MRYFLECSYNGAPFHGWQIQPNIITVQSAIEHALSTLLRQPIEIVGSGRTDKRVHARQQFAHFELKTPLPDPTFLLFRLNHFLPFDIAIQRIFPVDDYLHARFSATSRKYQYYIIRKKDPFTQRMSYFFDLPLDVAAMNTATDLLFQHDDFKSFSMVKTEVNHYHCRIMEAHWEDRGDELIFHVRADRFLRGMVRALVGTLLEVGLGRISVADFEQIILAKDRQKAGRAVPPDGLFLMEVTYPEGKLS
ncbi:MAG: tRNA pseudouridine(38-40) synthase TruA [Cytophagaceae bacterium]|nr:tRNA pseudouridine(38-40) synthase TruA [Cytophagaceae bacterium]